jgi:hypothetical protein
VDLIIAEINYYQAYWESLQPLQRVTQAKTAAAGFKNLAFAEDIPVCYEDSTGIPTNHMYFLNTEYIKFRYAKGRLFEPMEPRMFPNQDAETHLILLAGNLTLSNAARQGVLKA